MTIHACKGTEADNVLLLTDITQRIREKGLDDSERRVLYVGMTRARHNLYYGASRKGAQYEF